MEPETESQYHGDPPEPPREPRHPDHAPASLRRSGCLIDVADLDATTADARGERVSNMDARSRSATSTTVHPRSTPGDSASDARSPRAASRSLPRSAPDPSPDSISDPWTRRRPPHDTDPADDLESVRDESRCWAIQLRQDHALQPALRPRARPRTIRARPPRSGWDDVPPVPNRSRSSTCRASTGWTSTFPKPDVPRLSRRPAGRRPRRSSSSMPPTPSGGSS